MISQLKAKIRREALPILKIRIDGGTQIRQQTGQDKVAEYADAIREGEQLPAITVFFDGDQYWLADGYHRYWAHQQIDPLSADGLIECEIHEGNQRDAVLYAVGANSRHGLDRTAADKRRAVETLLTDPEWSQWSDREISRRCRVAASFVGDVRKSLTVAELQSPTRKGADGRIIDTTKIGKRSALSPSELADLVRDHFESWSSLPTAAIARDYLESIAVAPDSEDSGALGEARLKSLIQWICKHKSISPGDINTLQVVNACITVLEDLAEPEPVEAPAQDSPDYQLVDCPRCGATQEDYDGFGVVRCDQCDYCKHPAREPVEGGWKCEICGDIQPDPFIQIAKPLDPMTCSVDVGEEVVIITDPMIGQRGTVQGHIVNKEGSPRIRVRLGDPFPNSVLNFTRADLWCVRIAPYTNPPQPAEVLTPVEAPAAPTDKEYLEAAYSEADQFAQDYDTANTLLNIRTLELAGLNKQSEEEIGYWEAQAEALAEIAGSLIDDLAESKEGLAQALSQLDDYRELIQEPQAMAANEGLLASYSKSEVPGLDGVTYVQREQWVKVTSSYPGCPWQGQAGIVTLVCTGSDFGVVMQELTIYRDSTRWVALVRADHYNHPLYNSHPILVPLEDLEVMPSLWILMSVPLKEKGIWKEVVFNATTTELLEARDLLAPRHNSKGKISLIESELQQRGDYKLAVSQRKEITQKYEGAGS